MAAWQWRWRLRGGVQRVAAPGFPTLAGRRLADADLKAKFDAAGVHPDDFKSLADLAKFPFTTKQDLRDNYPYGMFAVPREQVVRVHASSGTTGKPKGVLHTTGGYLAYVSYTHEAVFDLRDDDVQ